MSKNDRLWHLEEDFFSKDRKASRKERKRVSQKDRSKFKKSNQDQLKKQTYGQSGTFDDLPRGRVLAIIPEGILVSFENKEYLCSLKGALKKDKKRIKNLVAVGDFVRFEAKENEQGTIALIEDRHSILSRADNLSRNKEQLIAVNIDQVFITASVVLPPLKIFLIDRYIIAAQKGNMEPIIVINKIDLLQSPPPDVDPMQLEQEKSLYEEFLRVYRALNISVIAVSITTGEGIEELKKAMRGKTSVFSGQSGVGKSSLINTVTGSSLATGSIVQRTRKGSHTTTATHLIPLEEGGFCIDTPGIKSFGLWDLEAEEIVVYFPEIFDLSSKCKFPDCSHISEPSCEVKKAVEEGRISPLRFASYCALISSLSEEHQHR